MYDYRVIDGNESYRFSDAESASECILNLGVSVNVDHMNFSTVEGFIDFCMFSSLENQFADLNWDYPDEMSWEIFVDLMKNQWFSIDYNIIWLEVEHLEDFLECFKRNFSGFIADKVATTMLCEDYFTITIGGRSVSWNHDLEFVDSGSFVK